MSKSFNGPSGERVTSNGSAQGDSVVDAYARAVREDQAALEAWHEELLRNGVRIASPDDGWVNRKQDYWMPPSYAWIRGPLAVGTVIALGTPQKYRLVRVKKVEALGFDRSMQRYYFEDVAR